MHDLILLFPFIITGIKMHESHAQFPRLNVNRNLRYHLRRTSAQDIIIPAPPVTQYNCISYNSEVFILCCTFDYKIFFRLV